MPVLRRAARLGALLLALAGTPAAAQGTSYEQLQTFSSLLNQIRSSYVDSVAYGELVQAAIAGVLESLDPHSRFVSRAAAEREMAYEGGNLAGAGIVLDEVEYGLTVLSVYPRSGAARAGVSAGDRLIAVNDTSVFGLTASEAMGRLIGEKGKKVRLLLTRGNVLAPDSVRVQVKFDIVEPRSVGLARMVDATTGYLRLDGFWAKGREEVERAIKDLKGKGMKRLIFDLRGNPGGSVGAAVEIASLFFPEKTLIFKTLGRRSAANNEFFTETDGPFRELPLMVLIDDGSASASEALAGSLQDHDRALILGRRSFGKALMQRLFLVPPQNDVVWLTVGRIVTPSGRIIQRAYRGLKAAQYYSFAGGTGISRDTSLLYRTDKGREVRGGGGIQPDVVLPGSPELPGWFSVAADSGWYEAIADSVAGTLAPQPAARTAWMAAGGEWQSRLVDPFLGRIRTRLNLTLNPDGPLAARLGRILAFRAAEVRWGPDAADEFTVRNDPDILAANQRWADVQAVTGLRP